MDRNLLKKIIFYASFTLVLTAFTAGGYALLARFLKDRQTAIARVNRPAPSERQARTLQRRTAAENERARREGRAPQTGPGSAADAGQAAIQRQLKTLEEINKINEMNRRLMEQQQQNQNRR